jgi:protein gp37
LRRVPARIRFVSFEPLLGSIINPDLTGIDWAIVGGESGPHARSMEAWWVEELHTACERQNVTFFFKQWGGPRKKNTGRLFKGRTWDEYPVVVA